MKSLKEKWLSMVQSTEEKGEKGIGGSSIVTTPPSSSPSPPPPSSTTEEESSSVTAYATPLTSPSPVLPVRILDKGKQREEVLLTPPDEPIPSLPCLICCFENHSLEDCLEFPRIPTVAIKDFFLLCILCDEAGHEVKGCPQYHCPICLCPTPGHGNSSCPNSPVDPSSDKEGSNYL